MNRLIFIILVLLIQGCATSGGLYYGGEAICVANNDEVLCTSDRATTFYTPKILEKRKANDFKGPKCYYYFAKSYNTEAGCRNLINYHMSYPTGIFMIDVTGFRKHQMINLLDSTDRIYRTVNLDY